MTAVAIIHKQDIIKRLSDGETITEIGKSLGVSKQAISQYLKDDPEYIAARIEFHGSRLDRIEGEISASQDQLDLARARELATMYRWRAERECRDLYGKDTVTQSVNVNLNLSNSTLSRLNDLIPNDTIEHKESE